MKKPILIVVGAASLLLIGGVGYGVVSGAIDLARFSWSSPVPAREFAAHVNGESIPTALLELRFAQAKTLYESQGTPLTQEDTTALRQQILDDMVNEVLLVQYGKEQGIEATEEFIESGYQEIVARFPSEEEMQKSLALQGVLAEDVRRTVAQDYVIQQVIEKQASENNIVISEEEMRQTYGEAVAGGAEVPPFEEVQLQIQEFLHKQKIAQLIQTLIEQLRSAAAIEILG